MQAMRRFNGKEAIDELRAAIRVIDDEQNRSSAALVVGISIDMNTQRATLETWG